MTLSTIFSFLALLFVMATPVFSASFNGNGTITDSAHFAASFDASEENWPKLQGFLTLPYSCVEVSGNGTKDGNKTRGDEWSQMSIDYRPNALRAQKNQITFEFYGKFENGGTETVIGEYTGSAATDGSWVVSFTPCDMSNYDSYGITGTVSKGSKYQCSVQYDLTLKDANIPANTQVKQTTECCSQSFYIDVNETELAINDNITKPDGNYVLQHNLIINITKPSLFSNMLVANGNCPTPKELSDSPLEVSEDTTVYTYNYSKIDNDEDYSYIVMLGNANSTESGTMFQIAWEAQAIQWVEKKSEAKMDGGAWFGVAALIFVCLVLLYAVLVAVIRHFKKPRENIEYVI